MTRQKGIDMNKNFSNCVKCGNSKVYCKNYTILMGKLFATLLYSALNVARA